ncbi:MAG: mtrA 2 [Myxococcales bacterium]|nr:mtrA 2 [Myxococcales bacterium]
MSTRLFILVIDDEYDLAELIAELLGERGHHVTVAINGVSGMSLLMNGHFDLVISDFMMPVMDGVELVKRMRQDARLESIPVIMMSAHADAAATQLDGLLQGLLQKPFMPRRLFAEIDRVLVTLD